MTTTGACKYLKEYLEQRMRECEELIRESPILIPKKISHSKKAKDSHISSANVGNMMRKAGFDWTPYVFRAYFDSQFLMGMNNGKIANDYS